MMIILVYSDGPTPDGLPYVRSVSTSMCRDRFWRFREESVICPIDINQKTLENID